MERLASRHKIGVSRRSLLVSAFALLTASCVNGTRPYAAGPAQKSAKNVFVNIHTTAGIIQLEVFTKRVPKVAAWFLQQVDAKIFDGTKFFRSGHLQGQPSRPRFLEGGALSPFLLGENALKPMTAAETGLPLLYDWETTQQSGLTHTRGSVSLARDITGNGGVLPDIVISLETVTELDAGSGFSPQNTGFPIVAQVVSGMDIVDAIAAQPRDGKTYVPFLNGQILSKPVEILRIVRAPNDQARSI